MLKINFNIGESPYQKLALAIESRIIIFLNTLILFGQSPSNDPHWQLVWQDNFNYLNTNIWDVANNFDHYGEPQMYRTNNVSVSGGNLILTVKSEIYSGHSYTSGWVESKQSYNTQYGYIESRIKLPNEYGFWPAFWTFVGSGVPNNSNAAEIDIFEMLGSDVQAPNIVGTNIHKEYCDVNHPDYPVCPNIPNYGLDLIPTNFNYTDWHTYGIEWSPNKIIWYIDGSPVRFI